MDSKKRGDEFPSGKKREGEGKSACYVRSNRNKGKGISKFWGERGIPLSRPGRDLPSAKKNVKVGGSKKREDPQHSRL